MKPQLLITLPVLVLATSTAFAADLTHGSYLGAGVGVHQASDTDNRGDLDSNGFSYNIYGGHYFNRIVGLEGSYIDYADMKANGQKVMQPKAMSFSANLGYTFDSGVRPFALLGLSYVDLNATNQVHVDDDTRGGFHFGLGVEYTPMPNLTLRAISQSDAVSVDNYYVYGSKTARTGDSVLAFNSISLGASYKF